MRAFILFLPTLIGLSLGLNQREIASFVEYAEKLNCNKSLKYTPDDDTVTFEFHGFPNHPTFKTNENRPFWQNYSLTIDRNPVKTTTQRCLPIAEIGFAINGVPFFNLLSGLWMDASVGDAAEAFDTCRGHVAPHDNMVDTERGRYHYHRQPTKECIYPEGSGFVPVTDGSATLYGVALDGFPVYADPNPPVLDECHGAMVNGEYRYYFTEEYPYLLGCFWGEVKGYPKVKECNGRTKKYEMCSCEKGILNCRGARRSTETICGCAKHFQHSPIFNRFKQAGADVHTKNIGSERPSGEL